MVTISDSLIKFEKRAEKAADQKLAETFVDAEPLLASVLVTDHQIIFGRRGTGKTHILKYLSEECLKHGNIPVYLDLRSIGSNGSIYSDTSKTPSQRATPLLFDVLQCLHDILLNIAIDLAEELDLSEIGPHLDRLADSISTLQVVGTVESGNESTSGSSSKTGLGAELSLSKGVPESKFSIKADDEASRSNRETYKISGEQRFYLKFGSIQSSLHAVIESLAGRQIWLLLDEWSEVPLDLQPYLADLLRRCVIPIRGITLKIAAIEHRCNFTIRFPGEYLGIEVGADAGGDVNLDDFMVFDNDSRRSLRFFAALLFKHYRATEGLKHDEGPQTPEQFVHDTFTQITAFEEFVRAVEGVPRDAVYLASVAARRAYNRAISVQDVRASARDWFLMDKSSILRSDRKLEYLLQWIIDEVIAHRRARAFLLKSNTATDINRDAIRLSFIACFKEKYIVER